MRPRRGPLTDPFRQRLMLIDPNARRCRDAAFDDLAKVLRPGDVLVVNDAATIPASLRAHTRGGEVVEVRLLASHGGPAWSAVLFGAGDWRIDTATRSAPPRVTAGDVLALGGDLCAAVAEVSRRSPRLIELRFDRTGDALWQALHDRGRPVQYSHLACELPLDRFQTAYAGSPAAAEMPSAGRPLRGGLLVELVRCGVVVVALSHAAGLSSTGDPAIDGALPLPERYCIPDRTAATIERARAAGRRVIAVGTTVVRALEGCVASHGFLRAGSGVTDLVVGPGFAPQVVTGLVSGMHEPGESHHDLLQAFADATLLRRAHLLAEHEGYTAHEFGDSCLIAPGATTRTASGASSRTSTRRAAEKILATGPG